MLRQALGSPSVLKSTVVAVMVAAAAACTPAGDAAPDQPAVAQPSTDGAGGSDLGFGLSRLEGVDAAGRVTDTELLVRSAQEAGLSTEQIRALDDGTVTFAEHEALRRHTIACIRAAGFDAFETGVSEGRFDGVPTLGFTWGGDSSDTPQALASADYCEQYHSLPATMIYVAMNGPPAERVQARIDEAFVRFGRCLEDAGIEGLPDLDNYETIMQDELLQYADDPRHDCPPP